MEKTPLYYYSAGVFSASIIWVMSFIYFLASTGFFN